MNTRHTESRKIQKSQAPPSYQPPFTLLLQMGIPLVGDYPPLASTCQKPFLDQEGFIDSLKRFRILRNSSRNCADPHWPAIELFNDQLQDFTIHCVQAFRVNLKHGERFLNEATADHWGTTYLAQVTNTFEKPIRHARHPP